jgi:hypothetical protein
MVVHTCNHSTQEAKAGGSQVRGKSRLHSKTLSKKKEEKRKKNFNIFFPLLQLS